MKQLGKTYLFRKAAKRLYAGFNMGSGDGVTERHFEVAWIDAPEGTPIEESARPGRWVEVEVTAYVWVPDEQVDRQRRLEVPAPKDSPGDV